MRKGCLFVESAPSRSRPSREMRGEESTRRSSHTNGEARVRRTTRRTRRTTWHLTRVAVTGTAGSLP